MSSCLDYIGLVLPQSTRVEKSKIASVWPNEQMMKKALINSIEPEHISSFGSSQFKSHISFTLTLSLGEDPSTAHCVSLIKFCMSCDNRHLGIA